VFERLDVKDGRISHQDYRLPFDDIFTVTRFEYETRVVLRCRYSNLAELRERLAAVAIAMASPGIRLIGDGSMTDGHHPHLVATRVELVDDPIGANP
jgi:hypothetical protein